MLTRRGQVRWNQATTINFLRHCAYYRATCGGPVRDGEEPVCWFGCVDEPSCVTSEPWGGYRTEPRLLPRGAKA